MGTVLVIILILLFLGVAPVWNHSRSWGNGPMAIVALVLFVIFVMVFTGRL